VANVADLVWSDLAELTCCDSGWLLGLAVALCKSMDKVWSG
jgi:hypothetical protein